MDAPIFGKPNVMITPQSVEFGKYTNKGLSKLTPIELIDIAETYST